MPATHAPTTRTSSQKAQDYLLPTVGVFTLFATLFSFMFAANTMAEPYVKPSNVFIFGSIILNGVLSVTVLFIARNHIGGMTAKKAWNLSMAATSSLFLDVISLIIAWISAALTPATYLYLGFALLVDLGANIFTHWKRN